MGKTNSMFLGILKALIVILPVLITRTVAFGAEDQYPPEWEIRYTTKNLCYIGTDETVVIPESITTVEKYAFYGNGFIKTIIIPDTVTCIQDYSIYNVPNLRNIIFYGNPVIEKYGIYKCPELRSITTPGKGSRPYSYAENTGIQAKSGYEAGFPKSIVYLLERDTCKQELCNTTDEPNIWKSSKKSIAIVDSSGVVRAKRAGKAKITAKTVGGEYSYTVHVYNKTVSERIKQIKMDENIMKKTKYERIKAVHAWMIRNIQYDYDNYLKHKIPESAYTVKGALLNKKCVCAGYAAAFKKLMKACNISCEVVSGKAGGGRHAWNMVKLDGTWYHVDVTWDDPIINERGDNMRVYYTYFLKSTEYMFAHKHTFETSKYPKCVSLKYDNQFEF